MSVFTQIVEGEHLIHVIFFVVYFILNLQIMLI